MRPIYGCPGKFSQSWLAPSYFSQNLQWAFIAIDTKNVRTKLEVRSFTRSWDNRGTPKISAVPGYAHAPFSPKFLKGFIRMDLVTIPAKVEVRSFTRSWDNRGYSKKNGKSLDTPTLFFLPNF